MLPDRVSPCLTPSGARDNRQVVVSSVSRQLLRARDLADSRYAESLGVEDMARAASLSRAHFSEKFKQAFGVSPHAYLLTRRLERAASMLRNTDYSVAYVCVSVGLSSVGSFTTSFKRAYGKTPTEYRRAYPPNANQVMVPPCVTRYYGRPQHRTFREDSPEPRS
ncbi:MAG: helix-turn-helix transcriptional regulator [Solirubrobacterales bacterium]|nr:helix-turn-helix transcriptional regulator [Solirubrobacterales bacterium]